MYFIDAIGFISQIVPQRIFHQSADSLCTCFPDSIDYCIEVVQAVTKI